jgi:hypothetical protein
LAIPAAGVIQVVARDLWDNRTGRWKSEPTIGEDQIPVDEELAREPPEENETEDTPEPAN